LLSRDDLRISVWRTAQYTIGTLILSFGLGLFVALLLNEQYRFRGLARTLLIIPWATPWLVVTLIWFVMFNPQIGPVNQILKGLGLIEVGRPWLYQRDTAMPSVVITTSWRLFPAVSLIILASLQSIPPVLYEAAEVDGANSLQRFRHITYPGIRASIFTVITLLTIWSSKLFTIVWALTQGGPGDATRVLSVYTYQQAFASNRLGRGSAIAMVSFVITLVLVVFYFLLTRPQAEEVA
jgi:multiple sugar transport system permease protein